MSDCFLLCHGSTMARVFTLLQSNFWANASNEDFIFHPDFRNNSRSDTAGISALSPGLLSATQVARLGVWKLLLRNSIKSFSDGGKHLIPRCFASHRWTNLFNFAPTSRKLLCYVWLCCPLGAADAATLKVATWTHVIACRGADVKADSKDYLVCVKTEQNKSKKKKINNNKGQKKK